MINQASNTPSGSSVDLICVFFTADISIIATLDFQRADCGLFRSIFGRVHWEAVLKDKGVQEGWTFSKKEILNVWKAVCPHMLEDKQVRKKI